MNKALQDLIKISRTTGGNPSLVLGGGGNTSVKTNDGKYMYIKASGTALKDMSETNGWRRLDIESVRKVIQDKAIAKLESNKREIEVVNRLLLSCDDNVQNNARPSVEAHLHAILDKVVIHLHPIVISAFVNAKNGKAELEKLISKSNLTKLPLWIPYTDPGFMLAKKVSKMVNDYQNQHGYKPEVLFLEKHGLFVSGENTQDALDLVDTVIKLCDSKLSKIKSAKAGKPSKEIINSTQLAIRKAVYEATGKYSQIIFYASDSITTSFSKRKDAAKLLNAGPLNPDEIVYANGQALLFDKVDTGKLAAKLRKQIDKGLKPTIAFLVKDTGLFIAADGKIADVIHDIITTSLAIRMHAAKFGGVSALSKKQCDFIINWESEAFRKKQVAGAITGLLQNKIAIVTGAGSGLGKSIAIGLARAGAIVGLMDIDEEAAGQTSKNIKEELPSSQTIVLKCNVTDERQVNRNYDELINKWGGLDILVNAAGIAPAGPLVDMDVNKWRLALEINLTGYFLMAKKAAAIMVQQGIGGSIINLSSKSGIGASKNNTAYNATKAGEIHMARGWALELGQYGIRVNSVCPGNVFEGSKIWNPEYIKICAKKHGIKPQEVIPYYINQTALKREIKGQDIADSIIFLCSDQARAITGQTLVADAGQEMVR